MTYLEGVYWDLDGTIANTELEAHLPAFNFAFNDEKRKIVCENSITEGGFTRS